MQKKIPQILSFHPLPRNENQSLFSYLYRTFASFGWFTKAFLLIALIFIILTPFITSNYQTYIQKAATTDPATSIGTIRTLSSFNTIALELQFSGDDNKDTNIKLQFKKHSDTIWRDGLPYGMWG